MKLPEAEAIFAQMQQQIVAQIHTNTALVGIHSGGVWLMQRVIESLENPIEFGKLDAAMYRDDFAQRGLKTNNRPTWITFDVAGKDIILIDDIFYTGRTARAAINELFDYGRPKSVVLAVLVDRGGAELPIVPQIIGAKIPLKAHQNLQLSQDTKGKFHIQLEESAP